MESNDSPEIPDRGETSDIPSLPSGGWAWLTFLCASSGLTMEAWKLWKVKFVFATDRWCVQWWQCQTFDSSLVRNTGVNTARCPQPEPSLVQENLDHGVNGPYAMPFICKSQTGLVSHQRLTTNKMYNHCIIVMEKKKKKKKTDCLDTHYCNLTLEATEYWLQGSLSKEKPDKWNDLAQQQPTEQYRFIYKVTHRPNPFRFNDQHHYHEKLSTS